MHLKGDFSNRKKEENSLFICLERKIQNKNMLKIIITLGTLLVVMVSNAQFKGVTETGDEIILYKNGTWEYSIDSLNTIAQILKNDKQFLKDKASTFLVKSGKTNVGIWLNPKEWSFTKGDPDSPSEFKFGQKNKDKDLYSMLITEKTEIPVESLIDIALENARDAAPDIRLIEREYRIVNGLEVVMMKMGGTIQGIKFIYYGYYYSNAKGAYQFLTYTSEQLFKEYETDMEMLLNGFTEYK